MLYTIWVGGTEVNDNYFDNIHDARLLAREYVSEGYTDVFIEARKWSEVTRDAINEIKRLRKIKEKKDANA